MRCVIARALTSGNDFAQRCLPSSSAIVCASTRIADTFVTNDSSPPKLDAIVRIPRREVPHAAPLITTIRNERALLSPLEESYRSQSTTRESSGNEIPHCLQSSL
jgi:hypothetical protein